MLLTCNPDTFFKREKKRKNFSVNLIKNTKVLTVKR
jgi:hypothetical protein